MSKTRFQKFIKAVKKKLERHSQWSAYGIDIDAMKWGVVVIQSSVRLKYDSGEKEYSYREGSDVWVDMNRFPLLDKKIVEHFVNHGDYQVLFIDGKSILISNYYVPVRPIHRRYYAGLNQTNVRVKKDSKKKVLARRLKAREEARAKRELVRSLYYDDPYGINAVSNTSFGHPRRKFNVNDKGEANAIKEYKQRNIPTYSDD